ncbi:N-glycosylase/DNA lyase [Tissierella praeacuta DSM 18095]|uniref:DNA-(apurinic or apyrimidinic site) lyase n=1 Tax=Tissierella praeacuta DSM 18095 TaxID=1123404 RepID=A0A1M4XNT5_9FIRM|nr:DNA glycosylase [Tissierella praeacuta]TCU75483.1 N-glycosylase/DNA lyase [Tissierella praeacuta]SHE95115.1 N-glycosylase/DNA lyase [Tissierella praeacuta DSM 18095]SUO99802.1 DNA-3-methyladenine glycosylase [Tissierella praeacuta]
MKYNIIEEKGKIILKDIKNFEPKHIFECGQAFRWKVEEDKSYTTVAYGKVLNVKKENDDIILSNTNIEDFNNIWYNYFDLDRDYDEIKKELSKDPILDEAIKFGEGIRILNQEPFEMVISFITSANNQIPRIKRSIELMSKHYGEKIVPGEQEYYSFPTAENLSNAKPEDLKEICKVGFRGERIVQTARIIANGELDLNSIYNLTRDEGKELLMTLPGVGPKVSDCILLFAFNKDDAFPVDVWVKRVMEHFYLKEDTNVKLIGTHGARIFGNLAGFAQQYLFYYARELGIGK